MDLIFVWKNSSQLLINFDLNPVFRHVRSRTSRADRWMSDGERQCGRVNFLCRPREASIYPTMFRTSLSDRSTGNYVDSSANNTTTDCSSTTNQRCADCIRIGRLRSTTVRNSHRSSYQQSRPDRMESGIQRHSTHLGYLANWNLGPGLNFSLWKFELISIEFQH